MTAVLFALSAATTFLALCFVAFDAVAYRSLRRAVARGDLSDQPGEEVLPVRLNAMGQNPDITYRYVVFEVPPGKAAVVRGALHPDAVYTSAMVYDTLLQSVVEAEAPGPTLITERELAPDRDGRFTLVLAHRDPGSGPWLDISATARGIYFERHIGAAPDALSRLEIVDAASLSAG